MTNRVFLALVAGCLACWAAFAWAVYEMAKGLE